MIIPFLGVDEFLPAEGDRSRADGFRERFQLLPRIPRAAQQPGSAASSRKHPDLLTQAYKRR